MYPTALVLSANIHRRHITKGQRAMAVATILGDVEYKNYTLGVSKQYVSWARTTLENAPDLAANVLTGAASLDEAYKAAGEVKRGGSGGVGGAPEGRYRPPAEQFRVLRVGG